jgi:transcription termination factor Rho
LDLVVGWRPDQPGRRASRRKGVEAIELLLSKMGKTKSNGEFLSSMTAGK